MKKNIFVSLLILVSSSVLMPLTTLAESSVIDDSVAQTSTNDVEKNAEMQRFTDMQNEITSVLTVENGRYVYDEQEIKSIIDSFDFDNLAAKTGIEFTNESFFQDAITNIKNTKFESRIQGRNANRYNRNYTESGWNFRRDWMDTKNTNYFISEYRRIANDIGLIGTVASNASKIPAIQWAIGVGFAYDIWYFTNVADNTEKKNNGTGVVFELNIFTAYYSVWSQNEYRK